LTQSAKQCVKLKLSKIIMNSKIALILVSAAALVHLSACSTIKNMFPDKEKDYQFTTEIPPLEVPADIGKNADLTTPLTAASPETASGNEPAAPPPEPPVVVEEPTREGSAITPLPDKPDIVDEPLAKGAAAPSPPESSEPPAPPSDIPAELVKSTTGTDQLHIGMPSDKAWRIVGKALSRKSVEVTHRNQEERVFTVQYDPDEKPVEDGSVWNELVFIFRGLQGNEKEYWLKLVDNNQETDVTVLDDQQHPVSNAGSLSLLKLLQETIKADFAK
jgi:outer membrane protein assembly factor BamC